MTVAGGAGATTNGDVLDIVYVLSTLVVFGLLAMVAGALDRRST